MKHGFILSAALCVALSANLSGWPLQTPAAPADEIWSQLPGEVAVNEDGILTVGYVMIGSDGGDLRYLMKSGAGETMVYSADVGDMNPENFDRMGTFDECLAQGFAFED